MEFLAFKNSDNWSVCKKCGGPAVKLFFSVACDLCDAPGGSFAQRVVWCSVPQEWADNFAVLPRSEFLAKYLKEEELVSFSTSLEEIKKYLGPGMAIMEGWIFPNFNLQLAKQFTGLIYGTKSLVGQANIFTCTVAYDVEHEEQIIKDCPGEIERPVAFVHLKAEVY